VDDAGLGGGGVGVQRGVLVGILPVAQVRGALVADESTRRERAAVVTRDVDGAGRRVDVDAVLGEPLDCARVGCELPS